MSIIMHLFFLFFLVLFPNVHKAAAADIRFVALGDLPYGKDTISGERYRKLIKAINFEQPSFSIHVGDIKSGSSLCSDEEFVRQRAHFDLFTEAVIYTPGDNDWTDCHRSSNGSYDPLERLEYLRKNFFFPDHSLGQKPLALKSQADLMPEFKTYVENQLWMMGSVLFVTLHIVGSNNNFEARDPEAVSEYFDREKANIAWIKDAFRFAVAQKAEAVVFSFQGDVFESRSRWRDFPDHSGFCNSIGLTLLPLARDYSKPVLLVHGDNHRFQFDQPFSIDEKKLRNVYRLVVPGDQDMRAV
ncbi:MAG: hypothetical protein ACKOW3_09205, partial [Hyphomicrobium sp.]